MFKNILIILHFFFRNLILNQKMFTVSEKCFKYSNNVQNILEKYKKV